MNHPHHRMEFKKAPIKGPWAGQTPTKMPPVLVNKELFTELVGFFFGWMTLSYWINPEKWILTNSLVLGWSPDHQESKTVFRFSVAVPKHFLWIFKVSIFFLKFLMFEHSLFTCFSVAFYLVTFLAKLENESSVKWHGIF